jgi:hypothetical protein
MNAPTYTEENIESVRSGQRWVIAAIIINLGSILFRVFQAEEVQVMANAVIMLTALVISLIGLVRLMSGLKYPVVARVLCCLLMFAPLLNIVILGIINRGGTKLLREHGFTVGLLGARKR